MNQKEMLLNTRNLRKSSQTIEKSMKSISKDLYYNQIAFPKKKKN